VIETTETKVATARERPPGSSSAQGERGGVEELASTRVTSRSRRFSESPVERIVDGEDRLARASSRDRGPPRTLRHRHDDAHNQRGYEKAEPTTFLLLRSLAAGVPLSDTHTLVPLVARSLSVAARGGPSEREMLARRVRLQLDRRRSVSKSTRSSMNSPKFVGMRASSSVVSGTEAIPPAWSLGRGLGRRSARALADVRGVGHTR